MPRPSPLPNRVTPFGAIVATAARGTMLGNRGGRIHGAHEIIRRQASPRWISCHLSFKGRRRRVMSSGYTELFFLDEATAFAAGHRPCFECRRVDALAFAAAWGLTKGLEAAPMADAMDEVLKEERRAPPPLVAAADLAPGAMVAAAPAQREYAPSPGADLPDAFLFTGSGFLHWTFDGYVPGAPDGPLWLLTPPSALAAFRAGYAPRVHPSAEAQPSAPSA